MRFRFRDVIFLSCLFKGLTEVEINYGWDHSRTALDGGGYILLIAAIAYGIGRIYDRWCIVRRVKHPQQQP